MRSDASRRNSLPSVTSWFLLIDSLRPVSGEPGACSAATTGLAGGLFSFRCAGFRERDGKHDKRISELKLELEWEYKDIQLLLVNDKKGY